MNILGINNFFEHPAVALVSDGKLVFAIEDERLTRIKHGKRYTPYRTYVPFDALYVCLTSQGLKADELDEIAYSYNRWHHLRSLWGCFTNHRSSTLTDELAAFRSIRSIRTVFEQGYELPLRYRPVLRESVLARLPYREWDHHQAHAASAFFCSGFSDAVVVVSDGSGECACTSVYVGRDRHLALVSRVCLPHSLGLFYSSITAHLGFEPFSDEYKVMGLAAYGEQRFLSVMERVVELRANGHYRIDRDLLRQLEPLLGPARAADQPILQVHKDIARSAQTRLERAVIHIVGHAMRTTGLTRLCLAGGTFLNCLANQALANTGLAQDIFVQPAAHDAGTAIGAAVLSSIRSGGPAQVSYDSMFLGRGYDDATIERALKQAGVHYERLPDDLAVDRIARLVKNGEIVGLFRGRMEFGPRALGHRSLIASARARLTLEKLNTLKGREQFRPLAPIVTEEAFSAFFEGVPNRYMMFTVAVRPHVRELIPAVVHADGTARAQIVRAGDDPFLHALLRRYADLDGVPVLINSSLNVRGKPIDESPADALSSFGTSGMDSILMGGFLVRRCDTTRAVAS